MWNGQRSLGHNRTLYIKDQQLESWLEHFHQFWHSSCVQTYFILLFYSNEEHNFLMNIQQDFKYHKLTKKQVQLDFL